MIMPYVICCLSEDALLISCLNEDALFGMNMTYLLSNLNEDALFSKLLK